MHYRTTKYWTNRWRCCGTVDCCCYCCHYISDTSLLEVGYVALPIKNVISCFVTEKDRQIIKWQQ